MHFAGELVSPLLQTEQFAAATRALDSQAIMQVLCLSVSAAAALVRLIAIAIALAIAGSPPQKALATWTSAHGKAPAFVPPPNDLPCPPGAFDSDEWLKFSKRKKRKIYDNVNLNASSAVSNQRFSCHCCLCCHRVLSCSFTP